MSAVDGVQAQTEAAWELAAELGLPRLVFINKLDRTGANFKYCVQSIIDRLRVRFPQIIGPRTDDICYATTNRQAAVRQLARICDLILVIGSRNSSNSKRLVEVASDYGARSYLIDNAGELEEHWLDGVRTLGITSGASAPEELVQELVALFRDRGVSDISEVTVTREDVRFMLPKTIRTVGAAQ